MLRLKSSFLQAVRAPVAAAPAVVSTPLVRTPVVSHVDHAVVSHANHAVVSTPAGLRTVAQAPVLAHAGLAHAGHAVVRTPTVVNANPTVVTHDATHTLHNAVAPHIVHQDVATPTATFLRNADGSLTAINSGAFTSIPVNSPFLRAFPSLNAAHLVHA